MNKKLELEIKIKAIREMKEPQILMHPDDLKELIQSNKDSIRNHSTLNHFAYANIPIKGNEYVKRKSFIVIDAFKQSLVNNIIQEI